MKKLVLVVLAVMLLSGYAYASPIGDLISKLPVVKEGIAVGITDKDSNTYSLTTAEILNWKDNLCLNAGLATDFKGNNIEVVTVSYKLASLKQLGLNLPLEQFVNLEVGVWAGTDLINTGDNKASWTGGVQASIINVKF